jgi:hypothetical protein
VLTFKFDGESSRRMGASKAGITSALAVIARNEAIQRPVFLWIASFLAMTADGIRSA